MERDTMTGVGAKANWIDAKQIAEEAAQKLKDA
jgi:hypothetical protein